MFGSLAIRLVLSADDSVITPLVYVNFQFIVLLHERFDFRVDTFPVIMVAILEESSADCSISWEDSFSSGFFFGCSGVY